ncbi:methyl-accepting chemotaxis protein [Desulfobacterales bacterium HSG2]|nr:methyl-accepting chemotaxis protein [Desulfobacterales bacterium HSG2]
MKSNESKKNIIKWSIKWKLMTMITLLMLSFLTVLTYFQISSQKRLMENELGRRIELIKENLTVRGKNFITHLSAQVERDIASFNFSGLMEGVKSGVENNQEATYAILANSSGTVFIHTLNPDLVQTELTGERDKEALEKTEISVAEYKEENESFIEIVRPVQISTEPWGVLRVIFTLKYLDAEIESSMQKIEQETRGMIQEAIFTSLGFMGMAFVIILIFVRSITEPVREVGNFAKMLSEGNLCAVIDIKNRDEIGQMAADLNHAAVNLSKIMEQLTDTTGALSKSSEELSSVSEQMASSAQETDSQAGTVAMASEKVTANVAGVASVVANSSESVSSIAAMTEEMSTSFSNMTDFAQRTSQNVNAMAQSSVEISSEIHNAASAVEKMTLSLNEVAKHTGQASHVSRSASQRAEEINEKIAALVFSSKRIGRVVSVIKDIADQTKMLALNATIEAAGAGKAGKGFAVVAGEVKELAKQSADATDEIAEQIEQIQSSTNEAVAVIEEIANVISEIAGINESIAVSVDEQTDSANEISRTIADNAATVKNIAEHARESAQLVEEIAKSTAETSETAKNVARHVDELAKGVKNAAGSAEEAAHGVQDISTTMQGITEASKETSAGAARTNTSSKILSRLAAELSEIVRRFKCDDQR